MSATRRGTPADRGRGPRRPRRARRCRPTRPRRARGRTTAAAPSAPGSRHRVRAPRELRSLACGLAGGRVTRAAGGERVRPLPHPLILEDQALQGPERAAPGLALGLEDGAGEDDLGDPAALRGHQEDRPARDGSRPRSRRRWSRRTRSSPLTASGRRGPRTTGPGSRSTGSCTRPPGGTPPAAPGDACHGSIGDDAHLG